MKMFIEVERKATGFNSSNNTRWTNNDIQITKSKDQQQRVMNLVQNYIVHYKHFLSSSDALSNPL